MESSHVVPINKLLFEVSFRTGIYCSRKAFIWAGKFPVFGAAVIRRMEKLFPTDTLDRFSVVKSLKKIALLQAERWWKNQRSSGHSHRAFFIWIYTSGDRERMYPNGRLNMNSDESLTQKADKRHKNGMKNEAKKSIISHLQKEMKHESLMSHFLQLWLIIHSRGLWNFKHKMLIQLSINTFSVFSFFAPRINQIWIENRESVNYVHIYLSHRHV